MCLQEPHVVCPLLCHLHSPLLCQKRHLHMCLVHIPVSAEQREKSHLLVLTVLIHPGHCGVTLHLLPCSLTSITFASSEVDAGPHPP